MSYTIEVALVEHKCWCGTPHMISKTLLYRYENEGAALFCPLGHSHGIKGEKESERITRELAAANELVSTLRAHMNESRVTVSDLYAKLSRMRKLVRDLRNPARFAAKRPRKA